MMVDLGMGVSFTFYVANHYSGQSRWASNSASEDA